MKRNMVEEMKNKKINIDIGSIWTTSDSKSFKVQKTEKDKSGKVWVFYQSNDTQKEYSCYEEAFVSRFTLFDNN